MSREPWAAVAELARLAPTPHNTQPFRIVPRGPRSADLVVVRDRLLPREDHGNLYMAAAFGIFATALEHGARYMGRQHSALSDSAGINYAVVGACYESSVFGVPAGWSPIGRLYFRHVFR